MKYQIQINKDFKDLDELAKVFAEIMAEVEKQRSEFDPLTAKSLKEHGDTISGFGWDIELIDYD